VSITGFSKKIHQFATVIVKQWLSLEKDTVSRKASNALHLVFLIRVIPFSGFSWASDQNALLKFPDDDN
jgi:hypothetical protein